MTVLHNVVLPSSVICKKNTASTNLKSTNIINVQAQ